MALTKHMKCKIINNKSAVKWKEVQLKKKNWFQKTCVVVIGYMFDLRFQYVKRR